jgi:hypothetical protein
MLSLRKQTVRKCNMSACQTAKHNSKKHSDAELQHSECSVSLPLLGTQERVSAFSLVSRNENHSRLHVGKSVRPSAALLKILNQKSAVMTPCSLEAITNGSEGTVAPNFWVYSRFSCHAVVVFLENSALWKNREMKKRVMGKITVLVARYLRASLTVTNTHVGGRPAEVRGGRERPPRDGA